MRFRELSCNFSFRLLYLSPAVTGHVSEEQIAPLLCKRLLAQRCELNGSEPEREFTDFSRGSHISPQYG